MNKEELGKLYPITVVPYDVNWTKLKKISSEISTSFRSCSLYNSGDKGRCYIIPV